MQQILSKNNLQTLHEQTYTTTRKENAGIISRFIQWCEAQESNRFTWLGVSLFGSIGGVLPLTLLLVSLAYPGNFILWIASAVVNVPVLAINLAAQPTKVTLPFLFFAWTTNLAIILSSLVTLFI